MNRLPNLPFLPNVPPQPGQAYGKTLNQAIGQLYQDLARSIDNQILTGTGTTLPGASGLRRFYYNGTTLYIDTSTTWTPVAIGNSDILGSLYSRSSTVLPSGCYPHALTVGAGPGIMVPTIVPLEVHERLNVSNFDLYFSTGQASAVGSSQAKRLTIHAAIYSSGVASWSLMSSTTQTFAWTVTGSTRAGTVVQRAAVPWANLDISPGTYYAAFMSSTSSSGNALAGTHSQLIAAMPPAFTFVGNIGESTSSVSTHQMVFGYAVRSASTSAWPANDDYSNWSHTGTVGFPLVVLRRNLTI